LKDLNQKYICIELFENDNLVLGFLTLPPTPLFIEGRGIAGGV